MKGISIATQDFKPVCNVKMIILRCIDKESGPAAAQDLRISSQRQGRLSVSESFCCKPDTGQTSLTTAQEVGSEAAQKEKEVGTATADNQGTASTLSYRLLMRTGTKFQTTTDHTMKKKPHKDREYVQHLVNQTNKNHSDQNISTKSAGILLM